MVLEIKILIIYFELPECAQCWVYLIEKEQIGQLNEEEQSNHLNKSYLVHKLIGYVAWGGTCKQNLIDFMQLDYIVSFESINKNRDEPYGNTWIEHC